MMNDQVIININYVYRPRGMSPGIVHGEAEYHGQKITFKLHCDEDTTEAISFGMMSPNRMSFDFLPPYVRMRHFDTREMIPHIKDKIVSFVERTE